MTSIVPIIEYRCNLDLVKLYIRSRLCSLLRRTPHCIPSQICDANVGCERAMTEEILGTLAREGGGVFRGQITYATILKKTGVWRSIKNFKNTDVRWQNISLSGYGSGKYGLLYQRKADYPN